MNEENLSVFTFVNHLEHDNNRINNIYYGNIASIISLFMKYDNIAEQNRSFKEWSEKIMKSDSKIIFAFFAGLHNQYDLNHFFTE